MTYWTKIFVGVPLGAILLVVGVTFTALEAGDVLTARTIDAETGEERKTHIWFATSSEGVFLEAGNPQSRWVRDLANGSTLRLEGGGLDGQHSFSIKPGRRAEIRQMMREKYGWRDRWIGMVFDLSATELIELDSPD